MVTFGSPFLSSAFSRVSSVLARNVILSNLRRTQEELLRTQEQLSTGLLINRPSDDPLGANRVIDFTEGIARGEAYLRNLGTAGGRLSAADGALDSADDLLLRAQEIFLEQRGGTADAASRLQASQEVGLLLADAVRQANARFEGRYLFAGHRTTVQPFVAQGGSILFRGTLDDLETDVADGDRARTSVPAGAFGAVSAELRGLDPVSFLPIDLDPAVTLSTRLSDLHRGGGVTLGSIEVTGTGAAAIDLGRAETVGDVVDLINARTATTGVTASLNAAQNGLELAAPGVIVVEEVSNGRTAQDLGILTPVAGTPSPLVGGDLDPRLTKETLLGDLFAGAGIDPSGIVVSNQDSAQTLTATLDATVFAPARTVEHVLNAVNGSGAAVLARINEGATGIDVLSRLSGGRLAIGENGGTTAAGLGLLSTLARARLADLNGGSGVGAVGGPDLRITKTTGAQVLIDVDAAATVQDLVDLINASDPDLSASITGAGLDQIEITDASGGPGNLAIGNLNGSSAATLLGIEGSAATTITGTPLASAGEQVEGVFTALVRLRDALGAGDVAAMDAASRHLDAARERVGGARADVGSRVLGLEMTGNRLEQERVMLEGLRSETRDTDLAEAATRFHLQQTVLEAALATAARILETHLLRFL